MTEYLPYIITAIVSAAAGIWYGHRWGRDDGYAEGYEEGRTDGLFDGSGVRNPKMTGGPMKDCAVSPGLLSGGPREPA